MKQPEVSVVMSVFNGALHLRETMDSVLNQKNVELELIVVNDGSTDDSSKILADYAQRDSRVIIIEKNNAGLTLALIEACQLARADYIARHDVADISQPHRLNKQLSVLRQNHEIVMVSTGTSFVAPGGEELYLVTQTNPAATLDLQRTSANKLKGPSHHGSVMFKVSAYHTAGGYRKEFRVAQDLDLWTRLVQLGAHHALPDILYKAPIAKNSISMELRELQVASTKVIVECMHRRKAGSSEDDLLKKILALSSDSLNSSAIKTTKGNLKSDAAYYYFLGSNLFHSNPEASATYLYKSLRARPLQLKLLIKLTYLGCRKILTKYLYKG